MWLCLRKDNHQKKKLQVMMVSRSDKQIKRCSTAAIKVPENPIPQQNNPLHGPHNTAMIFSTVSSAMGDEEEFSNYLLDAD